MTLNGSNLHLDLVTKYQILLKKQDYLTCLKNVLASVLNSTVLCSRPATNSKHNTRLCLAIECDGKLHTMPAKHFIYMNYEPVLKDTRATASLYNKCMK